MSTNPSPTTIELISSHILAQHAAAPSRPHPLFVLLQGPQGAGKTYLCSGLSTVLTSPPHNLRVAILSIDDLYLPHKGLVAVAKANPTNPLLQGRGQPGTHDMDLGKRLFYMIKVAREEDVTMIPVFDKSLFKGEGDRADRGFIVKGKMDVVIVEGWCTGFYPLSEEELRRRYKAYEHGEAQGLPLPKHTLQNVEEINKYLVGYAKDWWPHFSVFCQITPVEPGFIHGWRLQQEHTMKAKNGGKGMTDEQVKAFVDRYLPGYYYFSDGVERGHDIPPSGKEGPLTPWAGRGLRVVIDQERRAVRTETF